MVAMEEELAVLIEMPGVFKAVPRPYRIVGRYGAHVHRRTIGRLSGIARPADGDAVGSGAVYKYRCGNAAVLRFAKIVLVGGWTGTEALGSIVFRPVDLHQRRPFQIIHMAGGKSLL